MREMSKMSKLSEFSLKEDVDLVSVTWHKGVAALHRKGHCVREVTQVEDRQWAFERFNEELSSERAGRDRAYNFCGNCLATKNRLAKDEPARRTPVGDPMVQVSGEKARRLPNPAKSKRIKVAA